MAAPLLNKQTFLPEVRAFLVEKNNGPPQLHSYIRPAVAAARAGAFFTTVTARVVSFVCESGAMQLSRARHPISAFAPLLKLLKFAPQRVQRDLSYV